MKNFIFSKAFKIIIIILVIAGIGLYLFKTKIGSINIPTQTPVSETTLPKEVEDAFIASNFSIPEGFGLNIFASNVTGARALEIDSKGRILVSQTSEGSITALTDTDSDGVADEHKVLIKGLKKPHGMAFRCDGALGAETCLLYVAESNALSQFDYDSANPSLSNKKRLASISSSISDNHFTRSLLFMPSPNEDTLLISVGSSCNVCIEKDTEYAKILAYDIKTKKLTEFARGLRNSVFMNLNPVTGDVWATEMGRDLLGDNIPPDEINIIKKDKNYGWPNCYGKNIHDDNFDKNVYIRNPCMEPFETESHVDLQAHSAPLGLSFIPEEGWPESHWYNLLVAYHGSWNRSEPTGYKIVRIKLDAKGKYLGTEDFITGWLTKDGKKLGRPADIKIFSGGTGYITDDGAGRVYRLIKK
ncbi:MAG: PQQ-dependent sugar dehydrogenase [Candidatus Paceibacterota bacterium]|jgi:glucose/arabinose dehydrogenase